MSVSNASNHAPLQPGDVLRDPDGLSALMIQTTQADGRLCIEWTVPPGRRLAAIPHRHLAGVRARLATCRWSCSRRSRRTRRTLR